LVTNNCRSGYYCGFARCGYANKKITFEATVSLRNIIEKTPIQSKKFLAYILSNIVNKTLLFWMISKGIEPSVIIWAITASAFIDIGYILGQAALDGFTRIAQFRGPSCVNDSDRPTQP
jgi:hypothetical protein